MIKLLGNTASYLTVKGKHFKVEDYMYILTNLKLLQQ